MALPVDLTTATVTAQYMKGDGTPETGTVSFQRTVYLKGTTSDVTITPHTYVATLDAQGRIAVSLPVTNDASYTPVGWTYTVSEAFSAKRSRLFTMFLLGDVDLADVSPTESAELGSTYLPLNGGTVSGDLSVEGTLLAESRDVLAELTATTAVASGAAATAGAALPKAGGTVTGALAVSGVASLDPATGVASIGGKNGLGPLRFCGFKVGGGAPTTGAWIAGDIIVTSTGSLWMCTISGTPGTWAST